MLPEQTECNEEWLLNPEQIACAKPDEACLAKATGLY